MQKGEQIKLIFGDDAPKTKTSEDLLGVAALARKVANFISTVNAPEGYVIGLHGPWGSGKSTLLNFVLEYLPDANEPLPDGMKIRVVQFKPWMVSGHQELLAAFVKVLSESVTPPTRSSEISHAAAKVAKAKAGEIIDAAAKLAVALDAALAGGLLTFASKAVKAPVEKLINTYLAVPSVQDAHMRLSEKLKKGNLRFLVIIDDIDRLSPEEMATIMQMVKTIGRLPFMIFLLAYDRGTLYSALDESQSGRGAKYLEKIVQHEIELPTPSRLMLAEMLSKELAVIVPVHTRDTRLQTFLVKGVLRWLKKPRDIPRLSNAVRFSFSILGKQIDPRDLLAMEGLRLFQPSTFDWVKQNRDFLYQLGQFRHDSSEKREAHVEDFLKKLRSEESGDTFSILNQLFSVSFGKSPETISESKKRNGIADRNVYDSYFSMQTLSIDFSSDDVDDLLSRKLNNQESRSIISKYIYDNGSNEKAAGFLDQLDYRYQMQNIPDHITEHVLCGLMAVGEPVLIESSVTDAFSVSTRFLFNSLLKRQIAVLMENSAYLKHVLDRAFSECSSASMCCEVFVECCVDYHSPNKFLQNKTSMNSGIMKILEDEILRKIDSAVHSGVLENAPILMNILRAWRIAAGSSNDALQWLQEAMSNNPEFCTRVALELVRGDYPDGQLIFKPLEPRDRDLLDLKEVAKAIRSIPEHQVPGNQGEMLQTVIKGIEEELKPK